MNESREEKEQTEKTERKESMKAGKDEKKKKKGIGYASDNLGQNQRWDTSQYHLNKQAKSETLVNLIQILESFLFFETDYQIKEEIVVAINESALLPLLESGFRSGSLLEIAKDLELFES